MHDYDMSKCIRNHCPEMDHCEMCLKWTAAEAKVRELEALVERLKGGVRVAMGKARINKIKHDATLEGLDEKYDEVRELEEYNEWLYDSLRDEWPSWRNIRDIYESEKPNKEAGDE